MMPLCVYSKTGSGNLGFCKIAGSDRTLELLRPQFAHVAERHWRAGFVTLLYHSMILVAGASGFLTLSQ